jgi:hypothetical protein
MSIQAFSINIPEISILYLGTVNEFKFKLFLSISQKLDTLFWNRYSKYIHAVPVHIQEISLLYIGTDNESKFKLFLLISQKFAYYFPDRK